MPIKNIVPFIFWGITLLWPRLIWSQETIRVPLNFPNQTQEVTVGAYQLDQRWDYVQLASHFSKDDIRVLNLPNRQIYRIDLVYTAFREDPNFDQEQLNLKRLEKLLQLNPKLKADELITWRLVKQTGCTTASKCQTYYHGFVVYFNKLFTKVENKQEIDSIEYRLKKFDTQLKAFDSLRDITTTDLPCDFPHMVYSPEYLSDEFNKFYDCNTKFRGKLSFILHADDKGRPVTVDVVQNLYRECNPAIEKALKLGLRWKRGFLIDQTKHPFIVEGTIEFPVKRGSIRFDRYSLPDSLADSYQYAYQRGKCYARKIDTTYHRMIPYLDKAAVSTVLYRNNWNPDMFVVDVTGSMSPYSADLLNWLRLNLPTSPATFVFFNDGDDRPDPTKIIGQTGGIYACYSADYTYIKGQIFQTMRRGGGGDLMENNIEALLTGLKRNSHPDRVIMIADNFSFPRDISLLREVNVPLDIILCGTYVGINTDYMNLARQYQINLHTLEADIVGLDQLKMGELIQIGPFQYELTKNGFVRK